MRQLPLSISMISRWWMAGVGCGGDPSGSERRAEPAHTAAASECPNWLAVDRCFGGSGVFLDMPLMAQALSRRGAKRELGWSRLAVGPTLVRATRTACSSGSLERPSSRLNPGLRECLSETLVNPLLDNGKGNFLTHNTVQKNTNAVFLCSRREVVQSRMGSVPLPTRSLPRSTTPPHLLVGLLPSPPLHRLLQRNKDSRTVRTLCA
jgi:hypothetical protein